MSQRVSANKKQAMTPNMLGAIVLALAFFVLFALSGVSASTTLKETTVSTYMPLPQLFFSLSSASILLISHRITTLSKADQILVLENGRIVEQGSHEELKEAGGIYQRICAIQSGAEEAVS